MQTKDITKKLEITVLEMSSFLVTEISRENKLLDSTQNYKTILDSCDKSLDFILLKTQGPLLTEAFSNKALFM